MILACTCKSDFQDKEHGKGLRAHTPTAKGWRCTNCSKLKAQGSSKGIDKSKSPGGD